MTEEIVPMDTGPMRPADARTRRCIDLMLRGQWVRGVTAGELAQEWGMALNATERYATEAAKFIRLCESPEVARHEIILRLREISSEDKPDRVGALNSWAKMMGVGEPRESKTDGGTAASRAERVAHLCQCLRDPDEELLEAMRMERKAIMEILKR